MEKPPQIARLQDESRKNGSLSYDQMLDVIEDCINRYELLPRSSTSVITQSREVVRRLRFFRGNE